MNEEQINFLLVFFTLFGSVFIILLFDALAKRCDKEHTNNKQTIQGKKGKIAIPKKAKRGDAQEPRDEHSSGASGMQINGDVLEEHKALNVK